MLNELHIENIAVIERADIRFAPGMNVMTGETGAGKSIVIDAIGAVLGGRVSRELVRHGAEKALVTASFDLAGAEDWLRENEIPWVEDSSNGDDGFTRNRFRHRILPLLQEENPALLEAISRTSELLREDDACLTRQAEEFLRKNMQDLTIPSKALLSLEPAVAASVLRTLCGSGLSLERTQALLHFAESTERGTLELPGQKVLRCRGMLIFEPRN